MTTRTRPRTVHAAAAAEVAAGPTRGQLRAAALLLATAVVAWLTWLILRPYLAVIVWAVTLAVVTRPMHERILRRVHREGLAAGLAVAVVALGIIAPTLFVGHQVFAQASKAADTLQQQVKSGEWKKKVESDPRLAPLLRAVERRGGNPAEQATKTVGAIVPRMLALSGRGLMEAAITMFALFFLYRDRRAAQRLLRHWLPLTRREGRHLLGRVHDTIWGTIYGTVMVAVLQGILGGLMFWWLGLPAPVLWGFVMALLAIIPVLGTFIVWVPAAIALALQGEVVKAAILVAWGALVVGLSDNLVYPMLVGKRMRMHTLPVFLSLLGGLSLLGASGIVVGPVVFTLAVELRRIWHRRGVARRRTARPRPSPDPAAA